MDFIESWSINVHSKNCPAHQEDGDLGGAGGDPGGTVAGLTLADLDILRDQFWNSMKH